MMLMSFVDSLATLVLGLIPTALSMEDGQEEFG